MYSQRCISALTSASNSARHRASPVARSSAARRCDRLLADRSGRPACDLPIAWNLLPQGVRDLFRGTLQVDDATWARGRGWALSIALIQLPYYSDKNPALASSARHVIREVLTDHRRTR
jgi:hypothetical protein